MKRNLSFFLIGALWLGWGVAFAGNASFEEGKHYQRAPQEITDNKLVKDLLSEANNKVQVLEFFSYGCSWCYKLDPSIEKWRKTIPNYVDFQRVPVEFQPAWRTLTKAYYAAIDLKALDKIHVPLFEAIHTEKISNTSEGTLKDFFVARGVKPEDFNQMFDSFDVNRKQKWASSISRAYRITAVPAVIVQGPKGTFVTSVRMAGSEDGLLNVVNYLVKQQHEPEAAGNSKKGENKQ